MPGFCTTGGAAAYSRALVSPEGEIAFVSDRADGMDAIDTLPVLEISYRLVQLSVPFCEKDAAKTAGAVWVSHKKTWACPPHLIEDFRSWLPELPHEFDLLAES